MRIEFHEMGTDQSIDYSAKGLKKGQAEVCPSAGLC